MSHWRIVVVVSLLVLPILLWAGVGSYYLWTLHWGFQAWWIMALSMGTGYGLALYWQRNRQLLPDTRLARQPHWTDRDAAAWKVIEARAQAAESLPRTLFSDVQYYVQTAQELAAALAQVYQPGTTDFIAGVTLPEILTVIELAVHDLAELVEQYVPGGHLLTIRDWRRAKQATEWYQSASKVWWLVSALFSPVQTAARFAASRVGVEGPWQQLRQDLLLWFHQAYLHRLGNYLIELYSGRLRVGATRYRQIMQGELPTNDSASSPAQPPIAPRQQVTIALVGQVKAGKSSLVNAILGERRALCDVLPATRGVDRYELNSNDLRAKLVLLDTPGYGHAGPETDQLSATREAVQESDLVFLVLHVKNPGRQADVNLLRELRQWFAARPHARHPVLLAVLTHIDLLSPVLEWAPPYNWREPGRPKEIHIREAAVSARDQLGEFVTDVLPVCTASGKLYGVSEELLPTIAGLLDEARGIALLRCLRNEADDGKIRKVFQQLLAVSQEAARIAWRKFSH